MMYSQKFKKLIYQYLLVIVMSCIVCILVYFLSIQIYKEHILKTNANMLHQLILKYPEEEQMFIETLTESNFDTNKGLEVLKKYGVDKQSLATLESISIFQDKIFLITLSSTLLIVTVLSIFYFRYIKLFYRKIDIIHDYTNRVLNDDYTMNIQEYEEGKLSVLKNDIYKITNKLREQREMLIKDKKYLEETLSDISHQIKTPLTSMNVINNLLYDDKIDKKVKKEFLDKNQNQLNRIEWLVTSLLKLSRLESGTIQLKKEKIKVSKLLESALEPLQIPMELKNQELKISGDKKIFICADYQWTVEALLNIIKNAHEHTSENGKIEITYDENPIYVVIQIKDNGEGICKEDLKHIFERFYKSKKSSKDSIGIGLNMSKNIIDKQQGDISVTSKEGEGTTFFIKFYKNVI